MGRPHRKATRGNRPRGLTLEQAFRWYMPGDPPPVGEIWHWSGAYDDDGYGVLGHCGKVYKAHRVSYTIFVGPIPGKLLVRHRTDVPIDVNPWNLQLGTHADNEFDRKTRGGDRSVGLAELANRPAQPPLAGAKWEYEHRGPADQSGTKNGRSVLTEAQVIEIRARYAAGGFSLKRLGAEYGVSGNMISLIVKRVNWTHI